MSFEQHTARIKRLIGLIEGSRTGTADELAKTLSVSRRTIFYDIDFLKGEGFEIFFCNAAISYRLKNNRNIP